MKLHELSLLEITKLLQNKEVTAEEIFHHFRNRALAENSHLNAMKSIAEMPASF